MDWSELRRFWVGPLDPAPLGLFRITYGLLLLTWLALLGPDLRAYFTDEGFLPRSALAATSPGRLSLLALSGEWWAVSLLWGLSLAVALMVTVGYRTRLATALAFVALVSFHHRNPTILGGADNVLRVTAFWLIFAPAGARFSVDAALRRARGEPLSGPGPAFAVRVLQAQLAWIYLATGLEKVPGRLWLDGSAVYYALQHSYFGRPWAHLLADFDLLLRGATWGTLLLELAFLPAVFLPVFQPYARRLAIAGAVLLQLGILVLMNIGIFPLVMLAPLLLFLPPRTARRLVTRLSRFPARWRSRRHDGGPCLPRPPPAPSTPDHGQCVIAGWAGATRARWQQAAAIGLGLVAAASFETALPERFGGGHLPSPINGLLGPVGLSQRWTMYAPNPPTVEFWVRAPALLADGTPVDLIDGWGRARPREPRLPAGPLHTGLHPAPLYSNWMRVHLLVATQDGYRAEYAAMHCRLRNAHLGPGQPPLEVFDLYYARRAIPPPGEPGPLPVRERHLGSYRCS